MRKYRPSELDDDITGPSSSTAVKQPSQFLQLMNDYEEEQADKDTSFTEETVDEEYNNYANSVPKRKAAAAALDPLKFWEVSIYNCHSCYIVDIYKKKLQDKQ